MEPVKEAAAESKEYYCGQCRKYKSAEFFTPYQLNRKPTFTKRCRECVHVYAKLYGAGLHRAARRASAVAAMLVVAVCGCAWGQDASFWSPVRTSEVVTYAAAVSLDSYLTQQPDFVEQDPLAKPFVHSVHGQVIGSSLGFAAGVVPSYLLFRFGHRKLANAWLGCFTGVESANAASLAVRWSRFRHW